MEKKHKYDNSVTIIYSHIIHALSVYIRIDTVLRTLREFFFVFSPFPSPSLSAASCVFRFHWKNLGSKANAVDFTRISAARGKSDTPPQEKQRRARHRYGISSAECPGAERI